MESFIPSELTLETIFKSQMEVAVLQFHTEKLPVSIFTDQDTQFGVFELKPQKCDPIKTPIVIQYTIDISDSMKSPANHGSYQPKIDFIKETLRKMLPYLLDNFHNDMWIQIGLFSTKYRTLIPMQLLTKDNLVSILLKIAGIEAVGYTNIGVAFIESRKIMDESRSKNLTYKHLHMFLTDGLPTDGIYNSNELASLVSNEYPTLFIGYGNDHNAELLKLCASHFLHSYQYVDNFEMTGQVYAEILYSILYTVIEEPVIQVEGGLIYDPIKNMWSNQINIPFWVAEKEYIYHICSICKEDVEIHIYNKNMEKMYTTSELPLLIDANNILDTCNLDKYIFKQKTLDLLSLSLHIKNHTDEIDPTEQFNKIKTEIADFYKQLRTYMREKGLIEDTFYKILCEDLCVSYHALKSQIEMKCFSDNNAEMNILSRRNAQATQSLHRACSGRANTTPSVSENTCLLKRSVTTCDYNEETQLDEYNPEDMEYIIIKPNIDEDDIENYQDTDITENIYSPSGMTAMARHISS